MLKQYIVDAFTDHVSTGNPAAVCVVDLWRSDAVTQGINCYPPAEKSISSEAQVRAAQPDQDKVRALDGLLLHHTAAGGGVSAGPLPPSAA